MAAITTLLAVTSCATGEPNDSGDLVEFIPTPEGIAECKNYLTNIVLWDEAVRAPNDMTLRLADAYCRTEGFYVAQNGTDMRSDYPLPEGFPISRAEREIWPKLTRAQQERALAFLINGSTIQSSLKLD